MATEFLKINNLSLAYTVYHPEKTHTVFFLHANSGSSNNWRKQVTSPVLEKYRLIAIDLPSHGSSAEMPDDADFSLPALADVMSTAIKQLKNDLPYIICAVSLGTNIAVEMLMNDLQPAGMLLAGPCIVGRGFELDKMIKEGADPTAVFIEDANSEMVIKYASEASISPNEKDRECFLENYYQVKGKFRSSLFATIAAGKYSDEIELLRKQNCPVSIVFGEGERVVNNHYLDGAPFNLWNDKIYQIPQASHLVNIDAAVAFNKLLANFANDIFTKDAV